MRSNVMYSDEQIIFITNDTAMMPQLLPGSMLAGQYVETSQWSTQNNGVYAVVMDGGMVLVRRIRENELKTKGVLSLYSDNPTVSTQVVMADDIHSMYSIHEIIKQAVL